ncbi:MAG: hypothetical protein GY906_17540 [bacterium]|nr:hypothetical protein [bacterium]
MATVKCSDVVALRKVIKERDKDFEQEFISGLPPRLSEMYQESLATDWVSVDEQMSLYLAAAGALFPRQKDRMFQLGQALAQKTYTGVYRIFLRIPTIQFVASRAAQIWGSYYDTGEMTVENREDKSLDLVLRSFPDLPTPMRVMAAGHVVVLLEMTGAGGAKITRDDSDPQAWRWHVTWN